MRSQENIPKSSGHTTRLNKQILYWFSEMFTVIVIVLYIYIIYIIHEIYPLFHVYCWVSSVGWISLLLADSESLHDLSVEIAVVV